MKVAVAASADDLQAGVDERFGRCPFFCIADTESGDTEFISNAQNLSAPQGAGIQSARIVVDSGAAAVICGHCGPKAFGVLSGAGVDVYVGVSDVTVRQALADLAAGKLTVADSADVGGHWM
jgi:predicted Fe-Mo cluster-binding NifX family protein